MGFGDRGAEDGLMSAVVNVVLTADLDMKVRDAGSAVRFYLCGDLVNLAPVPVAIRRSFDPLELHSDCFSILS